jgi:hypothetical protein
VPAAASAGARGQLVQQFNGNFSFVFVQLLSISEQLEHVDQHSVGALLQQQRTRPLHSLRCWVSGVCGC